MILDVSKKSSIYTSWEKLELSWDLLNLFHIFSCFTLNCIWHGWGGGGGQLFHTQGLQGFNSRKNCVSRTGLYRQDDKGLSTFCGYFSSQTTVFLVADLAPLLSNRPLQCKFQPHRFLLFGGNQLSALCFLIFVYTLGIDRR